MNKMLAACIMLIVSLPAFASEEDELAEMQKQLNQEVMSKPFSTAELAEIDAYIERSLEKNVKPEQQKAPSYWRPGYTCANITGYGWRAYRNCLYYHRYHGRYWY